VKIPLNEIRNVKREELPELLKNYSPIRIIEKVPTAFKTFAPTGWLAAFFSSHLSLAFLASEVSVQHF
jgi:hypothetical protein